MVVGYESRGRKLKPWQGLNKVQIIASDMTDLMTEDSRGSLGAAVGGGCRVK